MWPRAHRNKAIVWMVKTRQVFIILQLVVADLTTNSVLSVSV